MVYCALQVGCQKETDSMYLWLIKVFWRKHKTWLSAFVAYEDIDWPGKPQAYFTLVTADNLPLSGKTRNDGNGNGNGSLASNYGTANESDEWISMSISISISIIPGFTTSPKRSIQQLR